MRRSRPRSQPTKTLFSHSRLPLQHTAPTLKEHGGHLKSMPPPHTIDGVRWGVSPWQACVRLCQLRVSACGQRCVCPCVCVSAAPFPAGQWRGVEGGARAPCHQGPSHGPPRAVCVCQDGVQDSGWGELMACSVVRQTCPCPQCASGRVVPERRLPGGQPLLFGNGSQRMRHTPPAVIRWTLTTEPLPACAA